MSSAVRYYYGIKILEGNEVEYVVHGVTVDPENRDKSVYELAAINKNAPQALYDTLKTFTPTRIYIYYESYNASVASTINTDYNNLVIKHFESKDRGRVINKALEFFLKIDASGEFRRPSEGRKRAMKLMDEIMQLKINNQDILDPILQILMENNKNSVPLHRIFCWALSLLAVKEGEDE